MKQIVDAIKTKISEINYDSNIYYGVPLNCDPQLYCLLDFASKHIDPKKLKKYTQGVKSKSPYKVKETTYTDWILNPDNLKCIDLPDCCFTVTSEIFLSCFFNVSIESEIIKNIPISLVSEKIDNNIKLCLESTKLFSNELCLNSETYKNNVQIFIENFKIKEKKLYLNSDTIKLKDFKLLSQNIKDKSLFLKSNTLNNSKISLDSEYLTQTLKLSSKSIPSIKSILESNTLENKQISLLQKVIRKNKVNVICENLIEKSLELYSETYKNKDLSLTINKIQSKSLNLDSNTINLVEFKLFVENLIESDIKINVENLIDKTEVNINSDTILKCDTSLTIKNKIDPTVNIDVKTLQDNLQVGIECSNIINELKANIIVNSFINKTELSIKEKEILNTYNILKINEQISYINSPNIRL